VRAWKVVLSMLSLEWALVVKRSARSYSCVNLYHSRNGKMAEVTYCTDSSNVSSQSLNLCLFAGLWQPNPGFSMASIHVSFQASNSMVIP
jgi:hypothetical protein